MQSPWIRKHMKTELTFILVLIVFAFILFWDSTLDFWAARQFFHPENIQDRWFEQNEPLWNFFYHAAPWLTGILLLGSLFVLILSQFKTQYKKIRIYAVYVFLVVALGPGLVVNSVFKPYWGRPRPREVTEFSGKYQYRPFYIPEVGAQGKSFPCGHCSIAFSFGLFWFIFRRKNKLIAWSALIGSTGFGALMGMGRIAAGGHFFSDVVWAGIFSWIVAFILYYKMLRIPEREDGTFNKNQKLNILGETLFHKKYVAVFSYAILGILTITTLLLASPFHKEIELKGKDSAKIQNLKINIDQGNVDLILQSDLDRNFEIQGDVKGFGFPKNKVMTNCEGENEVQCEIHKQGFFSDYESVIMVKVNPNLVESLDLQVKKGDVDTSKVNVLPAGYRVQGGK